MTVLLCLIAGFAICGVWFACCAQLRVWLKNAQGQHEETKNLRHLPALHPGDAVLYSTYTANQEASICQDRKNVEKSVRLLLIISRVYLKTPNAPGQRTFSRCAAPFFLEIRQYSCGKMSCSAQKFLAAGHIERFQIHPRVRREFLDTP